LKVNFLNSLHDFFNFWNRERAMETTETVVTINNLETVATPETAQENYELTLTEPSDAEQALNSESIIAAFTWMMLIVISAIFWGSMVYTIAKLLTF